MASKLLQFTATRLLPSRGVDLDFQSASRHQRRLSELDLDVRYSPRRRQLGEPFYVPLYLQTVRGYGPIISGAVIVPMLVSHGIESIISGQIIPRTGRYNIVVVPGNFVWTIGVSLQTLYTRTTPIFAVCLIGFVQGIGIGFAFQRKVPLYCA